MAKYFSIRVVDAESKEDAIQKVENGEFVDSHELSDSIVPEPLIMELMDSQNKFPNGFSNWVETHHVIVQEVERMLNEDENTWGSILYDAQANGGTGGVWILCEHLTDKFEQENFEREDGDNWFEVIDAFLQKELA